MTLQCKEQFVPVKKLTGTRQEFRRECDVNHIIEKYRETGVLGDPQSGTMRQPFYGDFSSYPNLRVQLEITEQANADWERLPAKLRQRFGNNPAAMVEFCMDINNREEAIRLGIVSRPDPAVGPDRKNQTTPPQGDGNNGVQAPEGQSSEPKNIANSAIKS